MHLPVFSVFSVICGKVPQLPDLVADEEFSKLGVKIDCLKRAHGSDFVPYLSVPEVAEVDVPEVAKLTPKLTFPKFVLP